MAKLSKRMKAIRENTEGKGPLPLDEAVALVKANATAKFDETVEVAINLGVDPRHADQMVRGAVSLPHGTGKTVRVAVFARGPKAEEAQEAGADIVGAEDLMQAIQGGEINFDKCIATPDMMPIVGRLGKILGPRGLMPNPKTGTVTMDVKGAVEAERGGKVEFRTVKVGLLHVGVGKASFEVDKLAGNIRALLDAVNRAKPSGAKGQYLKKVSVSSTMGPGLAITLDSLAAPEAQAAE